MLAHATGGIPSTFTGLGCGHLFPAHPSAEHVAHWIQEQLTPYSGYLGLRAGLVDRSAEFSWIAALEQLQEILG